MTNRERINYLGYGAVFAFILFSLGAAFNILGVDGPEEITCERINQ